MSAFFPPVIFGPSGRGIRPGASVGGWNVLFATIDENVVNNTTPVLDNFLKINVIAGKTYAFEIKAWFAANGANDCRFTLGGTATLTRLVAARYTTSNANDLNPTCPDSLVGIPQTSYPASAVINTSLNGVSGPMQFVGMVTPATSGTFGFSWCTNAVNGNPTTRLRGSWMNWKLID